MKFIWNKLFLEERPSIGLSFFRIAVALTVGFHVLPSFLHLPDNYFSTAFKTYNVSFFTPGMIEWVQKSPDGLVAFFVALFCVTWLFFLIGLFSQISCILLTLACYYFYALNSMHIGTLSWDILLVTLVLMCAVPYHGDYFSMDCLRKYGMEAYKRRRPFFVQRLLQIQIAFTYFYTALYKITANGNWLTDNPLYYLLNYPSNGVTKLFLFRDFFAARPGLCYAIGVTIVMIELLMPLLLFYPRTRRSAIYLGMMFHLVLIWTLDVPTIFFFLFPAQLLLFINPESVLRWVEQKRKQNAERPAKVVFDGHCRFCTASAQKLYIMDLFGTLEIIDYHSVPDLSQIHPQLTKEAAASRVYLVDPSGEMWGGFFAFRRLCWKLPMLFPLLPVMYFPGMDWLGPWCYRWIADHRYLFHLNPTCRNNACFRR